MNQITETPGRLPGFTPCYWGSANQWECDENDHLNVRFYAHKINQATALMVSHISDATPANVLSAIRHQHIRFIAESRAATPLRVDCGVAGHGSGLLDIVSLMHDNLSGTVLAAFRTTLDMSPWQVDDRPDELVDAPDLARPRGLDPAALPEPPSSWERARDMGYRIVGRGVISGEECDEAGRLLPHAYVGRVSDGMPNLWAFLNPPGDQSARTAGELGGAALEQRLSIRHPLARDAVFTQLSGVRSLGRKTQHMAHLLYDESRGHVSAAMEAVGVAIDLNTRRAVPISEERRQHLEALLLR